jgi:hypothetical protein
VSPGAGYVSILVRTLLAASVTAVPPTASNAEVGSFARCYGNTVDIVLPQSRTGIPEIHLSVPSENVAIVSLYDGTPLFEDSPCHAEPLVARRVTGGLLDTPLGSKAEKELAESGVSPRFFHLFRTHPDLMDFDTASRLAIVEADGVDQLGGLRVVYHREHPAQPSLVRLPLAYRTPRGSPVVMLCNHWLGCEVTYALSPAFFLRYEILNATNEKITAEWVEIDRGVRSMLLSWIKAG